MQSNAFERSISKAPTTPFLSREFLQISINLNNACSRELRTYPRSQQFEHIEAVQDL